MKSFNDFVKHKGITKAEKMDVLHRYRDHLMKGKGKRYASHTGLIKEIKQKGGSFNGQSGGSFWSWIKGAANTVYNKAIKPAYEYARDKPLSTIGKVAGVASFIPSPFSAGLKGLSTAANAAGAALGKGQKGAGKRDRSYQGGIYF